VQEWGCRALKSLSVMHAANRTLIGSCNGVQAVVAAMRTHADVAAVQQMGCHALTNLSCDDANRTLIGSCNGVQAIVAAMRTHADVAAVQEWGCGALTNLSARHAANQTLIGSCNGVQAIVAAMRAHADVAVVQEWGCRALNKLSAHAANRTLIGSCNGLQAMVTAFRTHADVWWAGFRLFPKRVFAAVADYTKCMHAGCVNRGYAYIGISTCPRALEAEFNNSVSQPIFFCLEITMAMVVLADECVWLMPSLTPQATGEKPLVR
jgi:phosphoribosylformylglycinamidine (FGAM) synthase-like amidotransferase family enzyme